AIAAAGGRSAALPAAGRLVALQPHGERLPLFCVHPAGGNTFAYRELMECLGPRQPYYAFQSDGFDSPLVPGLSVEEMAASYVAALRKARDRGPYHVGGWSMGGTVAYEIARQLQAAGEEVGLLVLFDTRADIRPEGAGEMPRDAAPLFFNLWGEELGLSLDHLESMPVAELLPYVIEQSRQQGHLPDDFTLEEAERLMEVYNRNRRAMWNYTPLPYAGSMVLFQAKKRRPGEDYPLGLGWARLVQGSLRTYMVPGDHNNLLVPPYVAEVAEILSGLLAEFGAGGGGEGG
ncbi:MAG: alpha/beta fold hydrolase, partial [Acidobacteriota bacterium]|nr:alpha/beta fold hydrolase [Acidobacteriota bacterium]